MERGEEPLGNEEGMERGEEEELIKWRWEGELKTSSSSPSG